MTARSLKKNIKKYEISYFDNLKTEEAEMRLFQKEMDEAEKLFQSFTSGLKAKKFDLRVLDKKQIKEHLGRGMYKMWEESLGALRYRKVSVIFDEKEPRISWLSDNYLDRLVVNIARLPDKEILLKTEKELLEFLEPEEEIS